jgi:GNAT superfamily N-acetyltransferase
VEVHVEVVAAAVTFPLRQQVLRPHQPMEELALPGDDDPDALHVAARTVDSNVVGTASVRREPPPWEPARSDGWRLRGMATTEELRGRGIGGRMLDVVLAHVAAHGGGLLWCNARVPAEPFYARAGLASRGDPWIDPDLGPHVAMWCWVAPARAMPFSR